MDLLEIMRKRRSIRSYTQEQIPEDGILNFEINYGVSQVNGQLPGQYAGKQNAPGSSLLSVIRKRLHTCPAAGQAA